MTPEELTPAEKNDVTRRKRRTRRFRFAIALMVVTGCGLQAASIVRGEDTLFFDSGSTAGGSTLNGLTILAKSDGLMAANNQRPRRVPEEAIAACANQQEQTPCSFNDPRRNQTISGTCTQVQKGVSACFPNDAPPPRG
ncbi:hypothetical protein [Labrenzia sp. 011]|uniref:hypothetical protein n=1 Tax=Labrenzia sp. 011 TaxID=2171494 RepID=UPI000D50B7AE|nr:hypothetical protein [Labrenzia sp. 011]PVB62386.1 hypothetical protein DCO57_06400 [Labrenzia sp. 011]